MDSSVPVPAHLRRYVVQQNYAAYTARDQAVWRFVLLQTHARLLRAAHPAYAAGFVAAGIEVDRIPDIAHMSERLASTSFQTVCVDGFIPPRAFQAFQARGVLPIAADIRTAEHLTYTPAPDIIHEAAGHAPFLAHPDYARYLRRIGVVSEHAFESAHDRRTYDAIHLLSELKEDPASTRAQVQRAEQRLAEVQAETSRVSEATRMARLYWWTVEYGLVGTLADYRLYGAGLLSSIGEAHFCHEPDVRKLPLDASCVEMDYDITRTQPQLFVAPDFAALETVLDDVAARLSHRVGGVAALTEAQSSGEVATLALDNGLSLSGVVQGFADDLVTLVGPARLSRDGRVLAGWGEIAGYTLPLGAASGRPLSGFTPDALRAQCRGDDLLLRAPGGLTVTGRLGKLLVEDGRVLLAALHGCEIARSGAVLLRTQADYPLVLAERVLTASAAVPEGFYASTPFAATRVPKTRSYAEAELRLIELHDRVTTLMQSRIGSSAVPLLEAMHRTLADSPDEWLLRWNLLEALVAAGEGRGALALTLAQELERLEIRYGHREPIATGLAQLRALVADGDREGGLA